MTRIVLGNHEASGLSDADVARIALACELQLQLDVCRLYRNIDRRIEVRAAHEVDVRPDDWLIDVDPHYDWSSRPVPQNAFHAVNDAGVPYGKINPGRQKRNMSRFESLAHSWSHEVVEITVDPYLEVIEQPDGSCVEAEPCDPVADVSYLIDGVPVCNLVGPAWFSPWLARFMPGFPDQLDVCGVLSRPGELRPGGWINRLIGGQWYRDDGRGLRAFD